MISDGQIKVVYNTSAFEKAQDPRLRALLQYLSTATVTDEARPIADKVAAFKRLFPDGRPHMKYELDLYDKWNEGRTEGLKVGIEQGQKNGILQTALKALKQGVPLETVASFTGISITELEKLQHTV